MSSFFRNQNSAQGEETDLPKDPEQPSDGVKNRTEVLDASSLRQKSCSLRLAQKHSPRGQRLQGVPSHRTAVRRFAPASPSAFLKACNLSF